MTATAEPRPAAAAAGRPDAGLVVSYQTREGRERLVLVGVDENGVWVVYDVPHHDRGVKRGLLVERLLGDQEKAREACGLAVEYAACQIAFAQGRREEHPNPSPLRRPIRVPLWLIRRHASTAQQAVAGERDLAAEAARFERVSKLAEQQRTHPSREPQAVVA
jgi:hypothetical protein